LQNSSKTFWKILIIVCIPFTIFGCSKGSDSFYEAISLQKKTSINYVPKIGKGLSFFKTGTLTPTWQLEDIVLVPGLKLTNHHGRKFHTEKLRGKISVVAFLFTSCNGFCPILAKKLKAIEKELGGQEEIQFIGITVDPDFDNPARLSEFGMNHGLNLNNRFMLLTGTKEDIYHLVKNVFSSEIKQIDDKAIRKFAHTEHFYIIDQKMRLRSILNGTRINLAQKASTLISDLKREGSDEKNEFK
jgi:protein SCO1/2